MNKNFKANSVFNQKKSANSSIEEAINNIFQTLTDQVSESSMVVKEKLSRWASCKGIISVYGKMDLKKQNGNAGKARPIATFAFYPGIYEPTKLGSVAIYGADAKNYLEMLRKSSSLFGYEIKEVRAEMGMRLFVDVRLEF